MSTTVTKPIPQTGAGLSVKSLEVQGVEFVFGPQKTAFGSLPNGLQQVGATGQPRIAEDDFCLRA
jgi:hypothetical protein